MKTKMKKNPMMNESDFDITVPFNAKNKRSMDIIHLDKTFHMVLVNHDVYRCTRYSNEAENEQLCVARAANCYVHINDLWCITDHTIVNSTFS